VPEDIGGMVVKMTDKLKYGCIGAGGIADLKHLDGYSKAGEVEIAAICDTNIEAADRLAKKYNIPTVYNDYKEMFNKEKLDLVSICTPNYTHAQISF
jgi:predicted dehydrogenase